MSTVTMPSQKIRLFYNGNKLSSLYSSPIHHTVLSANHRNLCEMTSSTSQALILATDVQGSTVNAALKSQTIVTYNAYGNDNCQPDDPLLSRFTGQSWLPYAIGYALGNGYRLFNPELMRFHSADSLSPFGRGGINAYTYCANDPVNRADPSGKFFRSINKWYHDGYSYRELAPRLKQRNPGFSKNEYNSVLKSTKKRLKKAKRDLNRAISMGSDSSALDAITRQDILNAQIATLKNLAPDDNKRYNPNITRELLGNILDLDGPLSQTADMIQTPSSFQADVDPIQADADIQEAQEVKALQERLMRLRGG